jgi:hypothetical protein
MSKLKTETQLPQTIVSGSTYAIYYEFNEMKMWLSPKDARFPEDKNKEDYTCVSNPYARLTFTEEQLCEKILELTKKHPKNLWLYAVVE